MTNICFISSSGGHLQKLASLRDLAKIFPSFLIPVLWSNSVACIIKSTIKRLKFGQKPQPKSPGTR